MNRYSRINLNALMHNLILILFAIVPFLSILNGVIPFSSLLKDVICVLICVFAFMHGSLYIRRSDIGILIYLLLVVLSLMIQGNLTLSNKIDLFRYRAEYMITFYILFACSRNSINETLDSAYSVLKVIYYSSLVVALVGVVEYFNPGLIHSLYRGSLTVHTSLRLGGTATGRLMSTMGNPINLGLQMGIGSATGLFLLFQLDRKESNIKFLVIISIILFLFITFLTYSRTAYLSSLAIIGFFILGQIVLSKKTLKFKSMIILFGILLFIAVYLIVENNSSLAYRLNTINLQSFSDNSRFERAALAFSSRPNTIMNMLIGSGVGNIVGSSGQFVFEFGFASLLYESGIIGVSIFIIYFLRNMFFSISAAKRNVSYSNLLMIITGFGIGFFIAMLSSDVYAQYPYNMFFWFCVLSGEKIKYIAFSKKTY